MLDLTGVPPEWDQQARQHWADCVAQACAEREAWHTPPPRGEPRLRAALAGLLGHDPQFLSITSGLRAQVRPVLAGARAGARAADGARAGRLRLEAPSFADVAALARWVPCPVSRWSDADLRDPSGFDLAAADVLWLTHPARNPDGRTLLPAEIARVAECTPACARVVVNETYRWSDPLAGRVPDAVHAGSLSKILGGGAKVGWLADQRSQGRGPPPEGGPPRPWQRALARFIDEGGLTRHLDRGWRVADALAGRLRHALRAATGSGPPPGSRSGHLLLLAQAEPGFVVEPRGDLAGQFARRGLRVLPGPAFDAETGTVRMSLEGLHPDDYEDVERIVVHILRTREVTR